jgi:hypothetical protein
VVLGNPPWEVLEPKEEEFFREKDPEIANLPGSKRKEKIKQLERTNPGLYAEWLDHAGSIVVTVNFMRFSGRYPLTAKGDANTYRYFAELGRDCLSPRGRMGMIVPTGIATDDSNKVFFGEVVARGELAALYDFENREGLFPAVDSRMKFSVFVLRGGESPEPPKLLFFATRPEHAEDPGRLFTLSPEDFALLNPNTRTCPVFRTRQDAELTKAIYRRVPVLWREAQAVPNLPEENPWKVVLRQGLFNMTADSDLFRTREDLEAQGFCLVGNRFVSKEQVYLPLYEAKMFWHYDHRFATFAGKDTRDVEPGEKEDPTFLPCPATGCPRKRWRKG